MKKQSGFTLIELMVVMAIIAILATAGLSAYTGYIKKARDTTRIADLEAIYTVAVGLLSTGSAPTAAELTAAVTAANNAQALTDPQNGNALCIRDYDNTSAVTKVNCGYKYIQCDSGTGFSIGTKFESPSNQSMYQTDEVGGTATVSAGTGATATESAVENTDDDAITDILYYEVGSCRNYCRGTATTGCTVWSWATI